MSDDLGPGAVALVGAALAAVVYMHRPAKHFSWAEATTTNTGLPNEPDLMTRVRMRVHGTKVMDPIRNAFGPISVTSWYRSPAVNVAIKGSKNSDHLRGVATDFYAVNGTSGRLIAKWLWDNQELLPLKQVIFYRSTGHLHVSSHDAPWNPGARRPQFLITATPGGSPMEPWTP